MPSVDWFEDTRFELPDEPPNLCEPALAFAVWAEALCAAVERSPEPWEINRAKLLLAERYFEWYAVVPRRHRETVRDHAHHCIFRVLRDAWFRLRQVQLSVDPPVLAAPVVPQPRPAPQIPALYLGSIEEE